MVSDAELTALIERLRSHAQHFTTARADGCAIREDCNAAADMLTKALEIIDDLNDLRFMSSVKGTVARLDPILEKAAAFLRENPKICKCSGIEHLPECKYSTL